MASQKTPSIVWYALTAMLLLLFVVLVQGFRARNLNQQGRLKVRQHIARWARVSPSRISILKMTKVRAIRPSDHRYRVRWYIHGRFRRKTCYLTMSKPTFGAWSVQSMSCRQRRR